MNASRDQEQDTATGSVKVEVLGFILLAIFNVVCNIVVCVVIRRSRRVQSTTNYFVTSLSIADILFTFSVMPFVIGQYLAGGWIFSDAMCRIVRFLQFTIPGLVTYLLLSICLDRYYTIIYPLSFKIRRGTAKRMIIASCITISIHSIICLYVFQEIESPGQKADCRSYVNITNTDILSVLYMLSIVLFQYIFPVIVIGVLYSKVFFHIWKMGACCKFQRTTNIVSRTKGTMVKLLMLITSATFLSYLPLYMTSAIFCFQKIPHKNLIVRICMWLVFLTGLIKPLLYFVYNANFRRGCREVLCFSGSRCYRSNMYAITIAPSLGKKNFVGVMPSDNGRSSPIRAFDRSTHCDANPWMNNNTVTSYV